MNILIIGHGAIARWLISTLERDRAVNVGWVLVRDSRRAETKGLVDPSVKVVCAVDELLADNDVPDYVIEAAGHEALSTHGLACLRAGWSLGVVSVGALADEALLQSLNQTASSHDGRVDILAGAVGGIDALSAAREGGLNAVTYSGRKPPGGWRGSPAEDLIDLDNVAEATCFFEGSAREAAIRFPKNANVAATIGLAGVGMDQTTVRLIADPDADQNTHLYEAEGAFGSFAFEIAGNTLPGNPRTSMLTAMSILRQLQNRHRALRF